MPGCAASRVKGVLLVTGCLVVVTMGCVSLGGRPEAGVSATERPYLLPPYEGWTGRLEPDAARELQHLWTALVDENEQLEALNGALALLEENPDLQPATVLEAQVRLVAGRPEMAFKRLEPVVAGDPGFTAAAVLLGRAAERLARPIDAFAAYFPVRAESEVATRRLDSLRGDVAERLSDALDEQLATGRQDAAARTLARLREWAPDAEATRGAVAAFSSATASPAEQLAMLRQLPGSSGSDPELTQRRAELEIEVGDATTAVKLAELLLVERPHDLYATHLLERARFQWRFNLLPSEVQSLSRRPELKRSEFAVLVYWLFPQVRYGRPAQARIATDVIDHPEREAIVRVINLGLLEVDATVHRFRPESRLERLHGLTAFLRLISQSPERGKCLEGDRVPSSMEYLCEAATSCRLLAEAGECLPGASLSGAEAVELARRTLVRLGTD